MSRRDSTKTRLSLAVTLLVLVAVSFVVMVTGSTVSRSQNSGDEECILCHVEIYDTALRQTFIHTPVFNRQCVVCHLADGSGYDSPTGRNDALISGTVGSQEILWRKSLYFPTATVAESDHLISFPVLDPSLDYRFRLAVSTTGRGAGGESVASLWFGLNPEEMANLPPSQQLDLTAGLTGAAGDYMQSAFLFGDRGTVFARWQTAVPMHGWIELQELDGIDLEQPAREMAAEETDSNSHPLLKDPEDLTINACYQCHPESTLGTSHPVRLFSGRDVMIPDDLPTVEGMLTCVTCHDPHSAAGHMLVRETIKTKLCVACHYKFKNSSPSTMFD